MGLSQALGIATQGMRATQAGLSLIAGNVANADTPGYVRKTVRNEATAGNGVSVGVKVTGVNRELDIYLQRQLRIETAGGAYSGLKAQFYQRLQDAYGAPGSESSLETLFNNFTSAVQALSANPSDYSARAAVLGAAQGLALQINGTANQIQALRSDAELGIADAVRNANEALAQIAKINQQLGSTSSDDASTASLLDQRDLYVDQLSELIDIRITNTTDREIAIFTSSGLQLVGAKAATLTFNQQGTITPDAQWNQDPTQSGVGTISLMINSGTGTDLIATNALRSGGLAALVEMRDKILVQAQAQLDEFAAAMARALSDKTFAGATAPVAPPFSGFDLDVGGLLAGNTVSLAYTDTATGNPHNITFVRVDDPKALPLSDSFTSNPNDDVIGIDWSGGLSSAISQLNAVFGGRITFSNPSGTILRILDDGGADTVNLSSASMRVTTTSLLGGSGELPFFMDGGLPFSGAVTGTGRQSIGLANRITVNQSLVADPSKLVLYSGSTPNGDFTRPAFIYQQLTAAVLDFSPEAGFGSAATPFSSHLPMFLRQVMSQQGDAALAAQNLSEGQDLVVNALQQRFDENSGVNIDQEMANLVTLQTSYAANARVLMAVKDVMDTLLRAI
jgi:flagellar hook-associated protein 1 FlgK